MTSNAAMNWTAAVQETVDATLNRVISSGIRWGAAVVRWGAPHPHIPAPAPAPTTTCSPLPAPHHPPTAPLHHPLTTALQRRLLLRGLLLQRLALARGRLRGRLLPWKLLHDLVARCVCVRGGVGLLRRVDGVGGRDAACVGGAGNQPEPPPAATAGASYWTPHNRPSTRRLQNMGFTPDNKLWLTSKVCGGSGGGGGAAMVG